VTIVSRPSSLRAQLRHVTLDDVRRRLRRRLVPEAVDQPVERDNLVRVRQQQRKQRTLMPASERDRVPVHHHIERTKNPVLDVHPPTLPRRPGS
jgi:hypothetical protein